MQAEKECAKRCQQAPGPLLRSTGYRLLDRDRLLRFGVDPVLEDIGPRVVAGDVERTSSHTNGGQIDVGIDDPDFLA